MSRFIVPQPKSITVDERGMSVRIVCRWFNLAGFALIAFVVAGIVVRFNIMKIPGSTLDGIDALIIAASAIFSYIGIALLINRTTFDVSVEELRVRHSPLLWPGNRVLDPAMIVQIYCIEKEHTTKGHDTNTRTTSYTYRVNAILVNNREIALIKGLTDPAQTRYLEYRLEKEMAIINMKVIGEF